MRHRLGVLIVLATCAVTSLPAQQADSARAGVSRDAPRPPLAPLASQRAQPAPVARPDSEPQPPISPRRAFLYSFVLPGAGQAKLDRAYAGGLFFLVEATGLTLLHRSAEDLRIARSFRGDSVPLRFQQDQVTGIIARDASGKPLVAEWAVSRYDSAYVRTRRLHYEDWLAVLFFNHLFAGADAFVAAQLWDLPTKLGARQSAFGPMISLTIQVP